VLAARKPLLKWLHALSEKLGFSISCFHLGINIFDRYTKIEALPPTDLGMVGAVCLFIAAKYESSKTPPLKLLQMCEFNRSTLIETETKILSTLKFELTVPTAFLCLRLLSQLAAVPLSLQNLAEQLLLDTLILSNTLDSNTFSVASSLLLYCCKRTANTNLCDKVHEAIDSL